MLFVPDMALRKVRNNIDRLFDKNLTDLIRGIRNNKENEARYIAACMDEIKAELRQESTFVKANAIEKLAYLQMLGYDISWASFNIIEVMASTKFNEKRIGYLAATQCFSDETDVLMLTTNMIRKDLQSTNLYDVGVALSGLACFATSDLSRDLVNDVVNLLTSSRPYVRKKAVLLLYKVFLKYPESLRPTFPRLKERLEDTDPGVQCAAVNVICELARKNPRNYLSLAPVFFKLMTTSSNNWMLIKIIKLFGSLVPLEARLGRKLLEPLTTLINSTSAMSLLYECINTVIAVLISIASEGGGDHTASIQLCVQKLGVLIEDSDQNLKYLGLLAMGRILQTHPKAVQAHKDIVLRCLDDKDESIRLRALDLLYGMVSKKNIMEIVKKLMEHVDAAEGSYYRDELLSRIISICSYNNYQYISNFEWYISVLVELTKVEGSKHGVLIAEQMQDVSVRVQSIRHFSVSQMALLVENAHLLLSTNSTQKNNICEVLLAAAWICGEYAEHVRDIPTVLEAMLRIKLSIVPGNLLSVYIQNIAKLYAALLVKYEKEDDWDSVDSLDNLMLSKLPEFQYSSDLEAQERACNLVELLRVVERTHQQREKLGGAFAALFNGELNPVAAKAQRRVPVPEGLDLDKWIVEPEPESEDSETESSSLAAHGNFPTIDQARQQFAAAAQSYAAGDSDEEEAETEEMEVGAEAGSLQAKRKAKKAAAAAADESRRRRQFELENNPYYVKPTAIKRKPEKGGAAHHLATKSGATPSSSELQSPLEIPGMIGLDRYLQQQESTLSWKSAKTEGKAKKGKSKGGKKRKSKKADGQNLSVLSSSDDEGGAVVVHQVNRDDGEMPENALSSADEAIQRVDDEFSALDMDLDAPLRADEKLFAPKPYTLPHNQSRDHTDLLRDERTTHLNGTTKKKTATKKKPAKEPKKPKTDEEKPKKKSTKTKKQTKAALEAYSSIESPTEPPAKLPTKTKVSKQKSKSKSAVGDILVLNSENGGFGTGFPTAIPDLFLPLCSNDRLSITYSLRVTDADTHRAGVTMRFDNSLEETVRRVEVSVLESDDVTLERPDAPDGSSSSASSASIVLPFELPARTCQSHTLHFTLRQLLGSVRLRATITYFVEADNGSRFEEKLDCRIVFPVIRFLRYSTIGASSFDLMIADGDLLTSGKPTSESAQPLKVIVDAIVARSNFSVVEFADDNTGATLYAQNIDGKPVCVLIKKKDQTYAACCKSVDHQLAQSAVEDIIDVIRSVG